MRRDQDQAERTVEMLGAPALPCEVVRVQAKEGGVPGGQGGQGHLVQRPQTLPHAEGGKIVRANVRDEQASRAGALGILLQAGAEAQGSVEGEEEDEVVPDAARHHGQGTPGRQPLQLKGQLHVGTRIDTVEEQAKAVDAFAPGEGGEGVPGLVHHGGEQQREQQGGHALARHVHARHQRHQGRLLAHPMLWLQEQKSIDQEEQQSSDSEHGADQGAQGEPGAPQTLPKPRQPAQGEHQVARRDAHVEPVRLQAKDLFPMVPFIQTDEYLQRWEGEGRRGQERGGRGGRTMTRRRNKAATSQAPKTETTTLRNMMISLALTDK